MAICAPEQDIWMDKMTTMTQTAPFWDRLAERYAAQPVKDQDSYEKTLNRVRAHLTPKDQVLELGCGTGSTALTLSDAAGHIHATDISSGMIEIANRKAVAAGVTNVSFGQADADVLMERFVADYPTSLKRNQAYIEVAHYYFDNGKYAYARKWYDKVDESSLAKAQLAI